MVDNAYLNLGFEFHTQILCPRLNFVVVVAAQLKFVGLSNQDIRVEIRVPLQIQDPAAISISYGNGFSSVVVIGGMWSLYSPAS